MEFISWGDFRFRVKRTVKGGVDSLITAMGIFTEQEEQVTEELFLQDDFSPTKFIQDICDKKGFVIIVFQYNSGECEVIQYSPQEEWKFLKRSDAFALSLQEVFILRANGGYHQLIEPLEL